MDFPVGKDILPDSGLGHLRQFLVLFREKYGVPTTIDPWVGSSFPPFVDNDRLESTGKVVVTIFLGLLDRTPV